MTQRQTVSDDFAQFIDALFTRIGDINGLR